MVSAARLVNLTVPTIGLLRLAGSTRLTTSTGAYGSPRVHAELTLELGLAVNLKRVARLMRQAGLQGLYRAPTRRYHPPRPERRTPR